MSILGGGFFPYGRGRKPGYDQIKSLLQEYQSLSHGGRARLRESELTESYVKPMFEALGWGISPGPSEPPGEAGSIDFELTYEDLVVPVDVKKPIGSDSGLKPPNGLEDADWGISTDFETVLIWDLSGPKPSLYLESGPEEYLNDEDDQHDVLAAGVFCERLASTE